MVNYTQKKNSYKSAKVETAAGDVCLLVIEDPTNVAEKQSITYLIALACRLVSKSLHVKMIM